MDINFLVKKWGEFKDSPEHIECRKYEDIRKEKISITNEKISKFLQSKIELIIFRNVIDNIKPSETNLRRRKIMSVWGADGSIGMMLFNMLIKYAMEDELKKLSKLLRKCMRVPNNIEEAEDKIDIFADYIKNFSRTVDSKRVFKIDPQKSFKYVKITLNYSNSKMLLPVFWDMQDLDKFPIYYTSCEKVIKKLDEKDNYYSKSNSPGKNYKLFYEFNIDLIRLLKKKYKDKKNYKFSDISTNYLDYIDEVYIEKVKLNKK